MQQQTALTLIPPHVPVIDPDPIKQILFEVCTARDLLISEVTRRQRRRDLSFARSECCYRIRTELGTNYFDISTAMGFNEPSTARWHVKRWPEIKDKAVYTESYGARAVRKSRRSAS